MSIEAPHSQQEKQKPHHWRLKFGAAIVGGLFAGVNAILGLDAARSEAIESHDAPTTSVLDHNITWTPNPEKEAKTRSVDPDLIEKCRESEFVVINLSGTGMETSHYAANMIQNIVEGLGGCSMYHWYGYTYDPEASAESIEKAVESVTPEGQRKQVILIGASFGGIAAEDIATQPAVEDSKVMDIRRIIMVQTPMDMSDVTDNVFGVPVAWIKNAPIPEFGGIVTLGNAIKGQFSRGEIFNTAEWNNTFINAAKTKPGLMRSELLRIQQGLQKVNPDISVDYVASPDSDPTVDDWRACQRLAALLGGEKVSYVEIQGGGHDEGWLLSKADLYNSKVFLPLLDAIINGKSA